MDHETAVSRKFVERYQLGDLNAEEAAAFEEHFFECAICAEEVRMTNRFVSDLKATLKEPKHDFQGTKHDSPAIKKDE